MLSRPAALRPTMNPTRTTPPTTTRRSFLGQAGVAAGGTWLTLHMGAVLAAGREAARQHEAGGDWQVLTPHEAAVLAAVADRIYPPDDAPGAAEIGAVRFMDAALGGFLAGALPLLQAGVVELDTRARQLSPADFSRLDPALQVVILREIERSPFFGTVHFMTMIGLFALPVHGGNRDLEGWRQLGFEPRHAWQPPFGHYDAGYAGEADDAGA